MLVQKQRSGLSPNSILDNSLGSLEEELGYIQEHLPNIIKILDNIEEWYAKNNEFLI